jgi:glutamyl-Q tRNA(Asp) synthetase
MPPDSPATSYIGRFAPSPTGPLHLGTLVAAMASYLEALTHNGQWLLRIEDLDPPREIPGSADEIITSLETLGFKWDGSIIYQSQRTEIYQDTLQQLANNNMVYACDCSRSVLERQLSESDNPTGYPGNCRHKNLGTDKEIAIRVITNNASICFNDRVKGEISQEIEKETGDFVIKRKDGLFAYQLAVVVDDALQNVSHVVRGVDLLDSTPRQIYLQKLLGLKVPEYAHTPLVLDQDGKKFSKSSYTGKKPELTLKTLIEAWHHLGQQPASIDDFENLNDFWNWAALNWNFDELIKIS